MAFLLSEIIFIASVDRKMNKYVERIIGLL